MTNAAHITSAPGASCARPGPAALLLLSRL